MDSAGDLIAPVTAAVHGFLVRCVPGRTLRDIFALAVNHEARALAMVPIIARNPFYIHMIESMDAFRAKIAAWEEEEKGNPRRAEVVLERTVSLLQKTATRNAVACLQVNRVAGAGLPRKKGDRVSISSRDQIPRALKAEEDCQNLSLPGADQAFIAGYHYDLLAASFSGKTGPKEAREALDKAWKTGLRAGRIAAAIVGSLKTFDYHSHAYGGALLAPIGKALMPVIYPKDHGERSWNAFVTQCEKMGDKAELGAWVIEHRRFAVTHAELSALVVNFVGFFGEVERAIACYRDPQRLQSLKKKGLYRLAGVISVANTLAILSPPRPESALNSIQLAVLKDCGFNLDGLARIVEKAGGEGR